jgi:hypothetical protein
MTETSLLVICIAAFIAVILLLSLLAGIIRVLTAIFPVVEGTDAALIAAISAAAARAYPGTKITNIQEYKP